ncbi:MAG: cache domain-containing protein [Spirochaetaceae bacterium]|jgi:signal transduction histidine kinase|nr:cache domain-containing protein [Spirochaetaceae bacterium]
MKKISQSIGRYYFLSLNFVVLFTAILSFGLAVQSGFVQVDTQMDLLSQRINMERRNKIKTQVESAIRLIDLERSNIQQEREKNLIEYVENAQSLILHYYENNRGNKSFTEIRQDIVELLRPIRFFEDEGYYFMFTPSGRELLYPVFPEKEGQYNLDWQDSDGTYFIREMVDLATDQRGGFIEYRISKPNSQGDRFLKNSYILYVPQLDVIIGSGYYINSVEEQAQKKAADSLEIFGANRQEIYFGASYDGTVVVGSNRGINRLTNPIGKSDEIIRALVEIAKSGGGYYQYVMPPLDEESKETIKLSYVLPYEDWQWYIGTGIYVEELSSILDSERNSLVSEVLRSLLKLLFLLVVIYGFLIVLIHRISKPIRTSTANFIEALERAVEEDVAIEVDNVNFTEFKTLAGAANEILAKKKESQQALFQKQKLEALGRLAGGVAHDINNQLTAVMGYADLLSTSKLNDEDKEYLGSLMDGAYRASDMVRELLSFARKDPAKKSRLDLHDTLSRVGQFIKRTVDKSIKFRLELTAANSMILGDDNKMYSLFLNLVINSVDAMPKGGLIMLTTQNIEDRFEVIIRDNGAGIDKENMDKIFDLYYTTKPQGKGTGLGLSLVYDTIKEHKGTIEVESEPDKGTVFTMSFPIYEEPDSGN